jgi:hypothetical protein
VSVLLTQIRLCSILNILQCKFHQLAHSSIHHSLAWKVNLDK